VVDTEDLGLAPVPMQLDVEGCGGRPVGSEGLFDHEAVVADLDEARFGDRGCGFGEQARGQGQVVDVQVGHRRAECGEVLRCQVRAGVVQAMRHDAEVDRWRPSTGQ